MRLVRYLSAVGCLAASTLAAIATTDVPLPREKPQLPTEAEAATDGPVNDQTTTPDEGAEPDRLLGRPVDDSALALCLADLERLGVVFEPVAEIEDAPCQVFAPLNVTALRGVSLSVSATLTCDMARATAEWLDDIVHPEARRLGADLTGLQVAASYICRTRNSQEGAEISEHGHANALDISAFLFETRPPIAVQPYDRLNSRETLFLDRVRTGACHHAMTVLGPGSDGFHADHIHLDAAPRSGGYRLCR
ncbi:MAG: extensin family protein [Pseudomonadota bacterium]